MQIKAKVIDVYQSRITIESDDAGYFDNLKGDEVILDVRGQGRSMNANKYFHMLSDRIAEKLRTSKPESKNILIGRYGQSEYDINGKEIILTVREDVDMMSRRDIHCVSVGYEVDEKGHLRTDVNGSRYVKYQVLRPTHTYTVKEMQVLIDGTVQDAESLGIPTITPQELEKLLGKWRPHK